MSAAVVEVPPVASNQESHDKLGDLVDKMEYVKIDGTVGGASDPEKIIKHPLQNAWTLWFFKNDKAHLVGEPEAYYHRDHSRRLLVPLQSHRGCKQTSSRIGLLPI